MINQERICFFAPNLAGGGAERVVSILAANFAKNGYRVDLVLANATGPYLSDIPSSVTVIDLKCKKMLFSLPKLVKYIRTYRPTLMFTSQMHSSTIAIWSAKLAGMQTRVFIRQPTMLMPNYQKKTFTSKLKQQIFLKTAKKAEKIIVTSEAMSQEFKTLSGISEDRIKVIYNPVPIEAIREKSLEPIEHPWFKKGEPPVILAVGRLVAVKDFQTLIKAFSIVQNDMPVRLIIVGEGELRNELKQLIENLSIDDVVHMPGFCKNPYQYMKNARVFVLSSLWEGFPNGMIEAMACGVSIVATDCNGGTSEILEYGKWGELVPVANEMLMAKSIQKTLNSEYSSSPSEKVDEFSLELIYENYKKLFEL